MKVNEAFEGRIFFMVRVYLEMDSKLESLVSSLARGAYTADRITKFVLAYFPSYIT